MQMLDQELKEEQEALEKERLLKAQYRERRKKKAITA